MCINKPFILKFPSFFTFDKVVFYLFIVISLPHIYKYRTVR